MAASIATSGSFLPTPVNTPMDARTVLNYKSEIPNIIRPYIGMIFYIKEEDIFYVVTSLKSANVNGILASNMAVNEYRPLVSANINFASTSDIQTMLIELGLTK